MTEWPQGWTRSGSRQDAGSGGTGGADDATRVIRRPDNDARRPSRTPTPPGFSGRKRSRSPRRWVKGVLIALLLVIVLLVGSLFYFYSKIEKVDALQDYAGRPAATSGQDWLIVGSDSRAGLSNAEIKKLSLGKAAGRRTDTIILLHDPAGGGRPTMVSLPRDSYVPIPGHGHNKLNAAFAFGGPPLLVRTVEGVTGIRIDHYAEIGFGGFVNMTDAVGGVTLCPTSNINDQKANLHVKKGCQQMDGATALAYVRARYFDPKGDLGRVERQQQFLAAIFHKMGSPLTFLNPFRVAGLGNAGTQALAVDKRDGPFDLLRFALTMRDVASNGRKITVPISDSNYLTPAGDAVKWDTPRALALFHHLKAK